MRYIVLVFRVKQYAMYFASDICCVIVTGGCAYNILSDIDIVHCIVVFVHSRMCWCLEFCVKQVTIVMHCNVVVLLCSSTRQDASIVLCQASDHSNAL